MMQNQDRIFGDEPRASAPFDVALVTGASGTVGRVLGRELESRGVRVAAWDRAAVRPGDGDAAARLFDEVRPEVVFHTALPSRPEGYDDEGLIVNETWTAQIAGLCARHGVRFVYVSTVMVFSNRMPGPFSPESTPDENEGYGLSKLRGERAAWDNNIESRVARLGWQIGLDGEGNNMVAHLNRQQQELGKISPSRLWIPATSFLEDTAAALVRVAGLGPAVYHLDSNHGWNFAEIVTALNRKLDSPWNVVEADDYTHDQRMIDDRVGMPSLAERLPLRVLG